MCHKGGSLASALYGTVCIVSHDSHPMLSMHLSSCLLLAGGSAHSRRGDPVLRGLMADLVERVTLPLLEMIRLWMEEGQLRCVCVWAACSPIGMQCISCVGCVWCVWCAETPMESCSSPRGHTCPTDSSGGTSN